MSKKHLMSVTGLHPIEVLTHEALRASEEGHWDHISALYQRRALDFVFDELPPAVVKRLIRMDQIIQERARVVQAATKQHLLELQERRRKLRQWSEPWTSSTQAGARFAKSV